MNDNGHARRVAEQLRLANDEDLDDAGIDPASVDQEAALVDDLIDQHESVDWRSIPGISTGEAAAWTARLIDARDALEAE